MGEIVHLTLRHLPDYTVVKLADGRVGYKALNTTSTLVFLDRTETEFPPNLEVEVIRYPATLAQRYLEEYERVRPWFEGGMFSPGQP